MLNISKFLDKFKKNIESTEIINNKIIDIIKNHTEIFLKINDFEIKNNVILLKTSPAVKNKIYIYKDDLIKDINLSINLNVIDIR